MTRVRILATLGIVLLALGVLPPSATANHTIPSPRYFWDPDLNNVPGPAPKIDPSGNIWESLRLARFDAALAEWRADTQFEISRIDTGNQDAYVDGRVGPCVPGGSYTQPDGIILAIVCRQQVAVFQGPTPTLTHYRLTDIDVYFNMENPDSPDWWIGSTLTTDPGRWTSRGS